MRQGSGVAFGVWRPGHPWIRGVMSPDLGCRNPSFFAADKKTILVMGARCPSTPGRGHKSMDTSTVEERQAIAGVWVVPSGRPRDAKLSKRSLPYRTIAVHYLGFPSGPPSRDRQYSGRHADMWMCNVGMLFVFVISHAMSGPQLGAGRSPPVPQSPLPEKHHRTRTPVE